MRNRIVIKIEDGMLVGVYAADDNVDVELVDVDNINAGDDEQLLTDLNEAIDIIFKEEGIEIKGE